MTTQCVLPSKPESIVVTGESYESQVRSVINQGKLEIGRIMTAWATRSDEFQLNRCRS